MLVGFRYSNNVRDTFVCFVNNQNAFKGVHSVSVFVDSLLHLMISLKLFFNLYFSLFAVLNNRAEQKKLLLFIFQIGVSDRVFMFPHHPHLARIICFTAHNRLRIKQSLRWWCQVVTNDICILVSLYILRRELNAHFNLNELIARFICTQYNTICRKYK